MGIRTCMVTDAIGVMDTDVVEDPDPFEEWGGIACSSASPSFNPLDKTLILWAVFEACQGRQDLGFRLDIVGTTSTENNCKQNRQKWKDQFSISCVVCCVMCFSFSSLFRVLNL